MAQKAANDESSYLSFLTDILKAEHQARRKSTNDGKNGWLPTH
jgi:hypothetical protein